MQPGQSLPIESPHTMPAITQRPTFGMELEARCFRVGRLSKISESANGVAAEFEFIRGPLSFFTGMGVQCMSDGSLHHRSETRASLTKPQLITQESGKQFMMEMDIEEYHHLPFNITEFVTDPTDSLIVLKQQYQTIAMLEMHLVKFVREQEALGVDLVGFKDWITAFNHDNPGHQIKPGDNIEDVYLFIKVTKDLCTHVQTAEDILHYPQFNFSATLEMLAIEKIDQLLKGEVEEGLVAIVKKKQAEAYKKIDAVKLMIQKEIDNKSGDTFAEKTLLPLALDRLKRANLDMVRYQNQCEIIHDSCERAVQIVKLINESLTGGSLSLESETKQLAPEKLRKLAGFMFVVLQYVATETRAWPGMQSTSKNCYVFFLKNKISELWDACLSGRDNKLLAKIVSDPLLLTKIMLKMVGGDERILGREMYRVGIMPVTVEAFIKSALSGNKKFEAHLGMHICDKIPTAGGLQPPLEPEAFHRKAPLANLIYELRWPAENITLDQSFQLMTKLVAQAVILNQTTKTLREDPEEDEVDSFDRAQQAAAARRRALESGSMFRAQLPPPAAPAPSQEPLGVATSVVPQRPSTDVRS